MFLTSINNKMTIKMKKIWFIVVSTFAIFCGACQGKTSAVVSEVDTVKIDSVVTDTIKAVNDSAVSDTVSAL